MALNVRQQRFADAYLANGGNATEAAIAAGYSAKTAKQQGSRLLTNADLAAYIQERRDEETELARMDRDEFLAHLEELIRADLRDVAEWDRDSVDLIASEELGDEAARSIQSLSVVVETYEGETGSRQTRRIKVRQHDKLRAAMLYAKARGWLTDKVEHSGTVGLTLSQLVQLAGEPAPEE